MPYIILVNDRKDNHNPMPWKDCKRMFNIIFYDVEMRYFLINSFELMSIVQR